MLTGTNIYDYKFDEYVKLISVVFQDFKLLATNIRNNIALDDDVNEDGGIMEICKKYGISDRIDVYGKRLDTMIYKMFEEDGVEPSGGETQKLATVRALYKNAPLVILDEPAAALDPIAEHEIYSNFNTLVGNKTAIYIT